MGKRLIRECIIVGGQDATGHVLGKTRDRNYRPNLEIVRDLTEAGIAVVYSHDLDTNYLEGMNSEGIGIVNAALLVSEMKQLLINSGVEERKKETLTTAQELPRH